MKTINLLLFFVVVSLTLPLAENFHAGQVMVFKGNTIINQDMEGLITLPGGGIVTLASLQVASWGIHYESESLLVYEIESMILSLYAESSILSLPDPDETVETTNGTSGTLWEVLETEPFVVYYPDIRWIEAVDTGFIFVPTTQDSELVTDKDSLPVTEGRIAEIGVKLSSKPASNVSLMAAKVNGDPDLTIQSGASLTFTPFDWDQFQTVTIAAAEDADTENGSAVILLSTASGAKKTVSAIEIDNDGDIDGDGMPDNWEDYYTGLNKNEKDGGIDLDSDGLINLAEYQHNTDPFDYDTDNDDLPDGWEADNGLDPTNRKDAAQDSDGDGNSNYQEYVDETDPQDKTSYTFRTATVMGTIFSTVNGYESGIKSASIFLQGTDFQTTTDLSGTFSFDNIPYGNYLIQAQASYFKPYTTEIVVNDTFIYLPHIELKVLSDINNDGLIDLKEAIDILKALSGFK
ncbi:carboxypeptidase regulatory-like domain-containing protein [Desulfobacula sp.]|uniref:carboxypeptidase regulatory-like domain-containing protein n=1 Tax=Desulfobacula sp. TaxID=2593537 RepID=UPI002607A183|nr:carboxypeptidase regulatory-like domain-containing protein [Desulfobacula sp.]